LRTQNEPPDHWLDHRWTGIETGDEVISMSEIQYLEIDGKPAFAVVPIEAWQRILAAAEDVEDVEDVEDAAACAEAVASDDGFTIPPAVLTAELDGAHPVRAWREHKGLPLQALADVLLT
jgi:hypothetical protein